jgi:L-aminopeptidase/D-esterase-like protein
MKRILLFVLFGVALAAGQSRPRARDLGVPFEGQPGPLNAITDVAGIEVGHSTIISGDSVRTGVTAVLPRGKKGAASEAVFAGWFSLNGNGEMTGTTWVEESGFLEGPVMITNTHSVGIVRDAVIAWQVKNKPATSGAWWGLPVVAETFDGYLNDINGFHVKDKHAVEALESARGGAVQEGAVGGGTGMVCNGFKGGIGTSSRVAGEYKVGVLVQCNYGQRRQLRVAGVPVGQEITEGDSRRNDDEAGSIIIVVATDAPLLPHQLKRLTRRAALGLARNGATSGNGSGDIFIAFSTANADAAQAKAATPIRMLPNDRMNPLFDATVQATEEAIINAMVAADTMKGFQGHTVPGLPHDLLREVLRKYDRLN